MGSSTRISWTTILASIFVTGCAWAQTGGYLDVRPQLCLPTQEWEYEVQTLNDQQPLFQAVGYQGFVYPSGEQDFTANFTVVYVNQDSGEWTMLAHYSDGTSCLVITGDYFEPVTKK